VHPRLDEGVRVVASDVHITGLRELVRAANAVDKAAGRQVSKVMRDTVGKDFVEDTRAAIEARGLVRTGRLLGSIKPSVRGANLVVRSTPPLNPGPRSRLGYAAVYEYGHGGRSFLNPTLDAWLASGKLIDEFDGFLDWVDKEFRW
jgi:hypothetical protein